MHLLTVVSELIAPGKPDMAQFAGHWCRGNGLPRLLYDSRLWNTAVVVVPWLALRCEMCLSYLFWFDLIAKNILLEAIAVAPVDPISSFAAVFPEEVCIIHG